MKTKKGFTLIELLIVIAIIGILSAALLPTILNAPGKARDSARILNMSTLATAIESYNADTGAYPLASAATKDGCINGTDVFGSSVEDYFSGSQYPVDPSGGRTVTNDPGGCVLAGNYYYRYLGSSAGQYLLATSMELDQSNNSVNDAEADATFSIDGSCGGADCDVYIQIQ